MMRSRGSLRLILALVLLAVASAAWAGPNSPPPEWVGQIEWRGELGYFGADRLSDRDWTRRRTYALLGAKYPIELSESTGLSLTFDLAGRAWVDAETDPLTHGIQPIGSGELRALSATLQGDIFSITAGAQEIAWGETFGFFIADVVNPRDFTDPLFNEPEWFRLPVVALNGKLLLDQFNLQLVFTPIARLPRLPTNFSGTPVATLSSPSFSDFPKRSEWGGKIGYLLEGPGIDLSAYYYHHQNRTPVYQLGWVGSTPTLIPDLQFVDTAGMSFSATAGQFVFRGDTLVNLDAPSNVEDGGAPIPQNEFETILGTDLTTESEWTLGVQYHLDYWTQGVGLHWASARISKMLFGGKLEPRVFFFQGLNNSDQWIQPELVWNITGGLSAAVRADIVQARGSSSRLEDGILNVLRDEDRVFGWVRLQF
jgi:hypothetical protein